MERKSPRVIDAEFEVVQPKRLRWWQGWRISFDWRVVAICAVGAAIAALRSLVAS